MASTWEVWVSGEFMGEHDDEKAAMRNAAERARGFRGLVAVYENADGVLKGAAEWVNGHKSHVRGTSSAKLKRKKRFFR